MALYTALPLLALMSSLLAAVVIFLLPEAARRWRTLVNVAAAVVKLILVAVMLAGVMQGHEFGFAMMLAPGLELRLQADALSLLFITLSAVLWLFTTVYAIGYLENSPNRGRFFGYFSLCVAATMGVATAGNLFTFFIFYELLTLATYPLVTHRGTPEAMRGGRIYLAYTLAGGAALLAGIILLENAGGSLAFIAGGSVEQLAVDDPALFSIIFWLLIGGIGVKAALVPLHGWLPVAMVAPAPVSALLHAVAVVKAGAFGITRIVFDVFGVQTTDALGLGPVLAALAAVTILYGSVRALAQTDIKRRLAFSTVSQVSYITLGIALAGPVVAVGGLVHLVHQGLMKITLFFCAGNWAETLGIHRIDQLDGVGQRMPWTSAAFTLGALGMIGVPPTAGFISKWYLGTGALQVGHGWVIAVLVASTVLNAAYFLPVLRRLWFAPPSRDWEERLPGTRAETTLALLIPTVIVALLALGAGVLAGLSLSPLGWAELIVLREYAR
ncbi:MAG: monovalent cation/H+ antiporter subunit D family protein [Gammaproteobacteria bacterium]|nr:monovalent cation/H+ antiporter subunit D family protein [Gammaproteobacteria bacterium]